jgi:hypothetical protein
MLAYLHLNNPSALTFVVPLVSALTLNVPEKPSSGGQTTITWTTDTGDPTTFTLELLNNAFHDTFAIGNNVVTADKSLSLELPIIPVGYVNSLWRSRY